MDSERNDRYDRRRAHADPDDSGFAAVLSAVLDSPARYTDRYLTTDQVAIYLWDLAVYGDLFMVRGDPDQAEDMRRLVRQKNAAIGHLDFRAAAEFRAQIVELGKTANPSLLPVRRMHRIQGTGGLPVEFQRGEKPDLRLVAASPLGEFSVATENITRYTPASVVHLRCGPVNVWGYGTGLYDTGRPEQNLLTEFVRVNLEPVLAAMFCERAIVVA